MEEEVKLISVKTVADVVGLEISPNSPIVEGGAAGRPSSASGEPRDEDDLKEDPMMKLIGVLAKRMVKQKSISTMARLSSSKVLEAF